MNDMFAGNIVDTITREFAALDTLPLDERIRAINAIRQALHERSPFKAEPVDCVLWIEADRVHANDYNPNSVAPPEMKLLQHSIEQDGYTQPIVAWIDGEKYEVVDGFHRNRVGKECASVRKRVHGYLPVTVANPERTERNDRIGSTTCCSAGDGGDGRRHRPHQPQRAISFRSLPLVAKVRLPE